jgi:NADH dehydrogenase/putative oxidoreductase
MAKIGIWPSALELAHRQYPILWFDPQTVTVFVVVAELLVSVFLVFGLMVRSASMVMLILSLAMQFDHGNIDVNLFCFALFGWYVINGPGALSLDRILAKGLSNSPLPFATQAISVGHWVSRIVGPFYQFAVRLWLAASLAWISLPATVFPVTTTAIVPRGLALICSLFLAVGFATPPVAAALFTVLSGMWMMGDTTISLYAPLLFLLLIFQGSGPLSIDRMLLSWIRKTESADNTDPHVVIVGGGFGGIACAMALRYERVKVTIIDRRNHHLFQPLLYQVATASLSPADIATPIRAMFRDDPNVTVLRGSVRAVDTPKRNISVGDRQLNYDYLVLATGSSHGYFGHDAWARHAPGLKTIEDAVAMRQRILTAFERAESTDDPAERQSLLTFLICGGGPTGVELAGAIAELARHGMAWKRNFAILSPSMHESSLFRPAIAFSRPFPKACRPLRGRRSNSLAFKSW